MSAIMVLMNDDTREQPIRKWHHVQIINFSRNAVNRSHRLQTYLKTNSTLNYKEMHHGT